MAKGRGNRYRTDEKLGEEELDDFTEHGSTEDKGHWRPPYGLIAVLCAAFLLIGFGGGFGAGWSAKPEKVIGPNVIMVTGDNTSIGLPQNVDMVRSFLPVDWTLNLNNDVVQQHYQQSAILNPAFHALSVVISTLGGTNNTYDPNVLRIYILTKYRTSQDTLAKLYEVAQRLQISPDFQAQIYSLSTSLVDVFQYIRNNQNKIGAAGRRLLAANSAEPLAVQLLKAFIKSGLQSPELQGALGDLSVIWSDVDDIVDLVVALYNSIRGIAAQVDEIANVQEAYHPTRDKVPPPAPVAIVGLKNMSVKVTVDPYAPLIVGEADDDIVRDVSSSSGSGSGRHLLQDQIKIPLPDGFTPSMPASMPNVLIPTVWHLLMYKDGNTYGPPGIDQGCDMVARMVSVANYRLAPAKFQLFVKECRNTPSYMYLVNDTRQGWLNCGVGGYISDSCPDVILDSVVDFPRAINIYVVSEQPPTEWAGYGWVPGDVSDPLQGHLGLAWTTVSTSGANQRSTFESGAAALVHEVMHHLGMPHTFVKGNATLYDQYCADGDAPEGVTDTPVALNPVWTQKWSTKAYLACQQAWTRLLASNWDTANRAASVRVGIPAADVNAAFDSCPNFPGSDETANYMAYTYDICYAALGHLTSGQVAAMHQITADSNPTLYGWGQWYALNPPPGATPSPSPPPPSPPPPSPPPPAKSPPPSQSPSPPPSPPPPSPIPSYSRAGACYSLTKAGKCKCASKWNWLGVDYKDCVAMPAADGTSGGTWCGIDNTNGDCTSMRGGWWDYCDVNAACAASPSPPPSPPPPPPSPPPPSNGKPSCGVLAPTVSGLTCTNSTWKVKGDSRIWTGCANPTNDPQGVWCVLLKGQATVTGAAWDYCQAGCNTASASPPPPSPSNRVTYPNALTCSNGISIQGNPSTCACADSYTINFDAYGTTYKKMSGCVQFDETGGLGMCVLKCTNNNRANKQPYACSCL